MTINRESSSQDEQPDLFTPFEDIHSGRVDPDTEALCLLIAGDPLHAADRAALIAAIFAAAAADGGHVDPNAVRKLVPASVYPRIFGPTYLSLTRKGILTFDSWTVNEDVAGGNSGKPARTYRLNWSPSAALGAAA